MINNAYEIARLRIDKSPFGSKLVEDIYQEVDDSFWEVTDDEVFRVVAEKNNMSVDMVKRKYKSFLFLFLHFKNDVADHEPYSISDALRK